jgi:hypothetical protein
MTRKRTLKACAQTHVARVNARSPLTDVVIAMQKDQVGMLTWKLPCGCCVVHVSIGDAQLSQHVMDVIKKLMSGEDGLGGVTRH